MFVLREFVLRAQRWPRRCGRRRNIRGAGWRRIFAWTHRKLGGSGDGRRRECGVVRARGSRLGFVVGAA